MSQASPQFVTQILAEVNRGDPDARGQLLSLLYSELHAVASAQMRGERLDHTLQPTALVHEAYLRLLGGQEVHWDNRAHFFAAAAEAMRRILVDHARAKLAAKRGGRRGQVSLDEALLETTDRPEELIAIDEALTAFEAEDPQKSQLVKLRFYAGLSMEEAAQALGISERTAKRQWRYAKAWLYRKIEG